MELDMIFCSDLSEPDIPEALAISLKELGVDYLSEIDFLEALDSESVGCMIAKDDGKVLGFAIYRIFGPEDVDVMLRLPDCPERDMIMAADRIGLFDSVAVGDFARGRGVGTELAEACMVKFSELGAEIVTAMAWEDYTGHANIGRILTETMGMTPSIALKGYWNLFVDSPEGHSCPMCGAPCRCCGRLHTVRLRNASTCGSQSSNRPR